MQINELDQYRLSDAVRFHDQLNPRLWGNDEHLRPEVRKKLLAVADDFQEFLGVKDLDLVDITVSGSNAAYSYTPDSDIDLHLVIRIPNDPVYQELFNAKKYQYNDQYDIRIGGADVELYVQPNDQPHISQGIYSVMNNDWVRVPSRKRAKIDDSCVQSKTQDLEQRIQAAVDSQDRECLENIADKIKSMRKTGLAQHGEFGCENLVFKMLRRSGALEKLKQARSDVHDRELSLMEKSRRQKARRWSWGGYWNPGSESAADSGGEGGVAESPDGVSADTKMFLNEQPTTEILKSFVRWARRRLDIKQMPRVWLHTNKEWSEKNQSFGQFDSRSRTLHVSLSDRHILDVMRTTAHELAHYRQHEIEPLPADAGQTGSHWENQAHAVAGELMREYADAHPEYFQNRKTTDIDESASGYIPTRRQARDPRFVMALTQDIRPGELGRQANKLALKTDSQGRPELLMKDLQNALEQFKATGEYLRESEQIDEIRMNPQSLRAAAAQTGARAGMEFEMIIPGVSGVGDDPELTPDYTQDRRIRGLSDIRDFFNDGEFNSRRDVERMIDKIWEDYMDSDWFSKRKQEAWGNSASSAIRVWVEENELDDLDTQAVGEVLKQSDAPDWNSDNKEFRNQVAQLLQELMDDRVQDIEANGGREYDEIFEKWEDEDWVDQWNNNDMFTDWLASERVRTMTDIERSYDIMWPYWTSVEDAEVNIQSVADDFAQAIGRPVDSSSSYHGAQRQAGRYVVEPDGSLSPSDSNDAGLEFVSPPLPIDEMITDLTRVKQWAESRGAYTNQSTGLHINVSVPGLDTENLDYVKLALLLGDEYVLKQFGRAANSYTASAMSKIRNRAVPDVEQLQRYMDLMRQGLAREASRMVHAPRTDKYTSINVQDGYIEFRSPGGDWLNEDLAKLENTLLRFVVALDAAVDPKKNREEYLKKLYQVLAPKTNDDPVALFARYSAGALPQGALKSFIRRIQQQRQPKSAAKPGDTSMKNVWQVKVGPFDEPVLANSESEAKKIAQRYLEQFWDNIPEHMITATLQGAYQPGPTTKYRLTSRRGQSYDIEATSELEALQKLRTVIPGQFSPYSDVSRRNWSAQIIDTSSDNAMSAAT